MAKRKRNSSQLKDIQIKKQNIVSQNDISSLENINLDAIATQNSINIKQVISTEENYSGPLPSPEDLAKYKELHPKALDVIFTLAINSQDYLHHHLSKKNELQELTIKSDYKIISRGQIFAFILTLLFFFTCLGCIYFEKEIAAIIFGSLPFGILAKNILPFRKSSKKETEKESEENDSEK